MDNEDRGAWVLGDDGYLKYDPAAIRKTVPVDSAWQAWFDKVIAEMRRSFGMSAK